MAKLRMTSAASRVFLILTIAAIALVGVVAAVLVADAERSERAAAEDLTAAVAHSIASIPAVAEALAGDDPPGALQPVASDIIASARVDFVTIMTPEATRVTHPDPAEIGKPYRGTVPDTPVALTEEFIGTLGASVRTIVPVVDGPTLLGWVSVGVTVGSIGSEIAARLPGIGLIAAVLLCVGFAAAVGARRTMRRVAGDLPAGRIRDAVASYESVRTLGEALRAQTHEHGNRMHTVVSLLELGRTREAIDLLAETTRQSQSLVDQITARSQGDPTVGALLLGKAAQARERGVEWRSEIDPGAPRSALTAIEAVSVVGNLVDNALDAAAEGPAPRWVSVSFASAVHDLRIEVSDSGSGVPPDARERVFDQGFSTKPASEHGRGVGLALVRSIVEGYGGTIELSADPTTFRVTLPQGRS